MKSLIALLFSFAVSLASSSLFASSKSLPFDSTETLKENRAHKTKKITIHVKVKSLLCTGAVSVSVLKIDSEISHFFDFELLVRESENFSEQNKAFISYGGVFLGTIYGSPTKQLLLSIQPALEKMIGDQKIISRGERLSNILG